MLKLVTRTSPSHLLLADFVRVRHGVARGHTADEAVTNEPGLFWVGRTIW